MFEKYNSYPIEPEPVFYSRIVNGKEERYHPRGRFRYPMAHGQCFWCSVKLTGRRRNYCSDKCRKTYWNSFSWSFLRQYIVRRDNYRCVKCGKTDLETDLQVDHIVAVVNGGEFFKKNNLQTLCTKCHKQKTSQDLKMKKKDKARLKSKSPPLSRFGVK